MCDLQKAMIWKRVSAFLFDMILLGIVVVGAAFSLSTILGYDQQSQILAQHYARYEQEYGVSFDLSEEEYQALTPEKQALYGQAYEALMKDQQAARAYSMMANLSLVITSISILLGYLVLEFAVPLLFGNGQTLGKKIFGIGVMRTDGVRLRPVQLFIRTILGKYTLETMVPVLVVMMIFLGTIGILGTVLRAALCLGQIILLAVTRTNSLIHDVLAGTVVIDMGSQMIFDKEEEMIAYKQKLHAEHAARAPY